MRSSRARTTDCSRSQPPSTQSVAEMRTRTGRSTGKASRTACATSSGRRIRFSRLPPYSSVRRFDERREELVEQVAVRRVDLDDLEPGLLGPARGVAEGAHDGADVVGRQLARHGVALGERPARSGADRLPAAAALADGPAAAPGRLGRGLAPGVRELDRGHRPLLGDEACDAAPSLGVGVATRGRCRSGLIRPSGETAVASVMTSPAPPTARLPRCTRCQSVGYPSRAEYWHIGETAMRLRSVVSRSRRGVKSALIARCYLPAGRRACVACSADERVLDFQLREATEVAIDAPESPTPCSRHSAAIRASCTRAPSIRPSKSAASGSASSRPFRREHETRRLQPGLDLVDGSWSGVGGL